MRFPFLIIAFLLYTKKIDKTSPKNKKSQNPADFIPFPRYYPDNKNNRNPRESAFFYPFPRYFYDFSISQRKIKYKTNLNYPYLSGKSGKFFKKGTKNKDLRETPYRGNGGNISIFNDLRGIFYKVIQLLRGFYFADFYFFIFFHLTRRVFRIILKSKSSGGFYLARRKVNQGKVDKKRTKRTKKD